MFYEPLSCASEVTDTLAVTEVNVLVVAVLVVLLGNTGAGSDMHPAIGESASPIRTATALPATNNKKQ